MNDSNRDFGLNCVKNSFCDYSTIKFFFCSIFKSCLKAMSQNLKEKLNLFYFTSIAKKTEN